MNISDSLGTVGNIEVDIVQGLKRALRSFPHKHRIPSQSAPPARTLSDITLHSHEILYRAKSVFPFDLFPDVIIIDKEKLTIITNLFFWDRRITSVPIRDILSVEVDSGLFFGTIKLSSRYFYTNPHSINFLKRKDALAIQRLLQGFIIANERNIDCSLIDTSTLGSMLEHLGETNETAPRPRFRF